jgi:glycosyltransferase involved in cell wall biosynthesis
LVPPTDVAALAEQLAKVIKLDPITRMRQGELNRRAALRYDWNHLAGQVRDEYLAAIAERAARTAGSVSRADLAQRA